MARNAGNGGAQGNGHHGNGSGAASLLRVREVAALLRVHPNTVRAWTSTGFLPCYRVGPRKDRRIPADAVKTLLEVGPV